MSPVGWCTVQASTTACRTRGSATRVSITTEPPDGISTGSAEGSLTHGAATSADCQVMMSSVVGGAPRGVDTRHLGAPLPVSSSTDTGAGADG